MDRVFRTNIFVSSVFKQLLNSYLKLNLKELVDNACNVVLMLSSVQAYSNNVKQLLIELQTFLQELYRESLGFSRHDSERLAVFVT